MLLGELNAERIHSNELNEKFIIETRALKTRLQQQEQWLESVKAFIGRNTVGDELADEYPEDRDVFEDDAFGEYLPGKRPQMHTGGISWSGDVLSGDNTPRDSPRESPRSPIRMSFGISGPLVHSGNWDRDDDDSHQDALTFAELKSPNDRGTHDSPERLDADENLALPHKSSLRKLFPLPASLSGDFEVAYKQAPPDTKKIDVTNASGKRRLDAIYEKLLNTPSVSFLRIKFGLKAVRTSLMHTINEDSLLRNYVMTVAEQNYSTYHNSDRTVSKLNKHADYLQSRVNELEMTRDDVVCACNELRGRVDSLSQQLEASRQQFADSSVAMEAIAADNEALKSENAVLVAKFNSMQLDYDNLFYERNNMVINAKKTNLFINELKLSNELLQSKLDQLSQRLSVTIVQRDELIRQFIDNANFDENGLGVDTLTVLDGSTYMDSDGDNSEDIDTIASSQRSYRRHSSFRSDASGGKFIPWS